MEYFIEYEKHFRLQLELLQVFPTGDSFWHDADAD